MTRTPPNVLFVQPAFAKTNFWNFQKGCEVAGAKHPAGPLGLITVAAMLPGDWTCRLVDCNVRALTDADFAWADLVMTGAMLPQFEAARALLKECRARGVPTCIGGPDPTSRPEAYELADFQVLGEAEGAIDAFIADWLAGAESGRYRAPKFKIDVTKTPAPRFDLLNYRDYLYLNVQFSRGCPFRCEFCDIIELYGRVPRTKRIEQVIGELDLLWRSGYRGHVDFVDDNLIGNKKAVKAFLPHLIAWQKKRRYPFQFSTEASLNLADDADLLAMMSAAGFHMVFIGIESPDDATLAAMQKKQNVKRDIAENIYRIYASGIAVFAGFIVGFDTERGGVAKGMVALIEAASIPVSLVGMLYALPGTQLTRRLHAEGRLHEADYEAVGDQMINGLNFETLRPRQDVLSDYRDIILRVYEPKAFFGRLERQALALRRPEFHILPRLQRVKLKHRVRREAVRRARPWVGAWRISNRLTWRSKPRFWRTFLKVFFRNRPAIPTMMAMTLPYLHQETFAKLVVRRLDAQIQAMAAGEVGPQRRLAPPEPAEPVAAAARAAM